MQDLFPVGDLGPCQAIFDGTDLGYNMDAKVKVTDETAPIKTAQTGSASVNDVITGRMVEIELTMTRSTPAQVNKIMPASTLTLNELMIKNPVGTSKREIAKKLVLKRIKEGAVSTDPTEWLTFFEAAPHAQAEWGFDVSTQRVTKAMFRAYPAEEVPSGETYAVGDIGALGYGETA